MSETFTKILSHDCGPFWQFAKYAAIGLASTIVQTVVFYLLAASCLKCLKKDDWAVRLLRLPYSDATDSRRAMNFAVATAAGFTIANIFCWLMNRWFVFEPGQFAWYVEFGMFFATSAAAVAVAVLASWALIRYASMMTTLAVAVEILVSLAFNYLARKFFIFKG